MASILATLMYRDRQATALYESLAQYVEQANANREKEDHAATVIAESWKAYSARRRLTFLRENVIKIQKSFRGALGRRLYDMRLKQMLKNKRMDFYNAHATQIQRIFRKFQFNFYERQAYLRDIEQKSHEVKKQLALFEKQRMETYRDMMKEKEKEQLVREAKRYHHLMSTKSVPGVLRASHGRPLITAHPEVNEDFILQQSGHRLHRHASWTLDQALTPKSKKSQAAGMGAGHVHFTAVKSPRRGVLHK